MNAGNGKCLDEKAIVDLSLLEIRSGLDPAVGMIYKVSSATKPPWVSNVERQRKVLVSCGVSQVDLQIGVANDEAALDTSWCTQHLA